MNVLRLLVLFNVLALLAACSSDGEERPEYLDSYSVKKLEVPPELTQLDGTDELRIPKPSAKILALLKCRNEVEGSVSPKFKGIELQSDADFYWLLIEKDADDVWALLRDFLANEGLKIHRDEPLLGFIETEWVKEYESNRDAGYLKKIFNTVSADKLDKFRLRLERVKGKKQTKLYISHRGQEIVVVNDGSSWQQTEANQMLEKELLYRMVLFVGLTQEKAEDVFAEYTPYQSRIRPVGEDGSSEYEIMGSQKFVWKRLMQAMDRLGAEIKSQDEAAGTLEVLVGEVADKLVEEKDELAESSWLMNLFSSNDKESKDEKGRISIFVTLKQSSNFARMKISLQNDGAIVDGLPEKFRMCLVGLLK